MLHTQLDSRTMGQVENPPFLIRTPVRDPNIEMFAIRQIHHTHHAAERHGPMGSRQRFHIEQFAIRRLPAMKLFTVP